MFSVDPISHTIVGDSIADYVMDIQRIKTNLTRAMLDSAAESINPKTVINELNVNVDDALNDELGAVIRVRGDPSAAVMYTSTPFLGKDMAPVVELLNDVLQRRTGLSDAARPRSQSPAVEHDDRRRGGHKWGSRAHGACCEVLAETGFKDLFSGLFNEIVGIPPSNGP